MNRSAAVTVGLGVVTVAAVALWWRGGQPQSDIQPAAVPPPAAGRARLDSQPGLRAGEPARSEGEKPNQEHSAAFQSARGGWHSVEGGAPTGRSADWRKAQREARRASRAANANANTGEGSEDAAVADAQQQDEARFTALQAAALHDEDPQNRIDALDDLKEFDDEQILPVLVKAVSDHDATVRAAAVDELSTWFREDAPFDALAQAARDPDPEVRSQAIQGLANLDEDPRAMAAIQQARSDPDEDVRSFADFYAPMDETADDETGGSDADADD